MKKIYRQPMLKTVQVNLESRMMTGSDLSLSDTPTTGSLSKDDIDTDTWGW